MQCCRPVNHQTPSPIQSPAPKRPAETRQKSKETKEIEGLEEVRDFFHELSFNCIGWAMAVNVG